MASPTRATARPKPPELEIVTSIGSPFIYVRQRTALFRINRATMRCSCWHRGDGPCLHVRRYLEQVAHEKGSSS